MRSAWYWLLLSFWGCSGQNVVAGEETTKQEQLAESLPKWCQQYCETLDACNEGQPCNCSGSSCSCVEVDISECTGRCQKELIDYTRGSEECAALAQSFKRCLEKLSCGELFGAAANDCEPTEGQRAVCPEGDNDEPSSADGPSSFGGSTSTAGSASTPYGTAGSTYGTAGSTYGPPGQGGAVSTGGASTAGGTTGGSTTGGAGPTLPDLVTCVDRYTGGADVDEPGAVVCEERWSNCSDGSEYSWICARGTSGQVGCSCFVDGQFLRGFAPENNLCPTLVEVSGACHFVLAQ